jgi:hypothetical protein
MIKIGRRKPPKNPKKQKPCTIALDMTYLVFGLSPGPQLQLHFKYLQELRESKDFFSKYYPQSLIFLHQQQLTYSAELVMQKNMGLGAIFSEKVFNCRFFYFYLLSRFQNFWDIDECELRLSE